MPVSTKRNQRSLDDDSASAMYEGLNQSQICTAFRLDARTVRQKLHGVEPCGIRNGSKVWGIWKCAPYLVKPNMDVEAYIKKMHHNELPKHLTKEFWAGQRARQDFLLKEGDLWPTTEVVKKVGELMKLMSMSMKLLADTVDRQAELTDKQRRIIIAIVDSTQDDLVKQVVENFSHEPKQAPQLPAPSHDEEDEEL